MQINALDNPGFAAASQLTRPTGESFAYKMKLAEAKASDAVESDRGLDPERAETLRTAAEQLVATTFIQPMLAKMREDPFKSDLFHGGQAEEIFGQRLDTIFSERIVSRTDFAIVDAVYRSIADKAGVSAGVTPEVDAHA